MKTFSGFTLIELMVTLAVFGILVLAAIPAFNGYVTSNRMTTETNTFVSAVNYAHDEAIKRRTTVSMCRSSDGIACATAAGTWSTGWIVFVNLNNDSPAQIDAGETILQVSGSLTNTLQASAAMTNFITFDARGYSNAQGQFVLCDVDATTGTAKTLSVNRLGRTRYSTGGGTCTPA